MANEDKAQSRSVSMVGSLWIAVENFTAARKSDRSEWIRGLVVEALAKENALPDDPIAAELARTKELIATRGIEVVKSKLDELIVESVEAGVGR